MGEIAEMMLDGTLCECCGEYMGDGDGYPGYCSAECAGDRGLEYGAPVQRQTPPPTPKQKAETLCQRCGKMLCGQRALQQHIKDKHGIGQ